MNKYIREIALVGVLTTASAFVFDGCSSSTVDKKSGLDKKNPDSNVPSVVDRRPDPDVEYVLGILEKPTPPPSAEEILKEFETKSGQWQVSVTDSSLHAEASKSNWDVSIDYLFVLPKSDSPVFVSLQSTDTTSDIQKISFCFNIRGKIVYCLQEDFQGVRRNCPSDKLSGILGRGDKQSDLIRLILGFRIGGLSPELAQKNPPLYMGMVGFNTIMDNAWSKGFSSETEPEK